MSEPPVTRHHGQRQRHIVVIGGGISGLAAAERLTRSSQDGPRRMSPPSVTVLETNFTLGGCIGTECTGGFVIERGPDVVLAAKPAVLELAERVGVADRLIGTRAEARGSYVMRKGQLIRLPEGVSGLLPGRFAPFACTRLLSPLGKLRVALEWAVPRRRNSTEETIESFVTRRLGREMYARVIEPLLSGIYAGDGARLSLDATFPQFRALEREHGGLLRATRRRTTSQESEHGRGTYRDSSGSRQSPGSSLSSKFLSFSAGLGELVDGVSAVLRSRGVTIRYGAAVARVAFADGADIDHVRITLATGEVVYANAVIVATSALAAAALLANADAELARLLGEIPHASTAVVTLAYHIHDVPVPLDATGYTVPRAEGRSVLACTWSSAKFVGRAPDGFALFRVFLGGVGRETALDVGDEALVELARVELRDTLRVTGHPALTRVARWNHAMPQYVVGHGARVTRIRDRLVALPLLALAGNAYEGVGIPDCIRGAAQAAERLLERMATLSIVAHG
ncbi:MAG: protoporphyrinogen oxidase [Gemmatimonadaceae bacterium]